MKKIFKILVLSLFIVSSLGVGKSAFAQDPNRPTLPVNPANRPTDAASNPISPTFQLVPCKGVDDPRTGATETECTYQSLILMVSRIIQFVLYLLIPIVLGMIVYIGFKFLTASGDSGKLADAKRMIKPLLIGIVLIFAAWLVVYTFLDRLLVPELRNQIVPNSIRTTR